MCYQKWNVMSLNNTNVFQNKLAIIKYLKLNGCYNVQQIHENPI